MVNTTRYNRKEKRGVDRKSGCPKIKTTASRKRALRAWDRFLDKPETFTSRFLEDLRKHADALERQSGVHASRPKFAAMWRERYEIAKEYKKMTKTAKKISKVNKEAEVVETINQWVKVVEVLRDGGIVTGYTIMRTEKAKINHTVEPIIEISDTESLCKYVK